VVVPGGYGFIRIEYQDPFSGRPLQREIAGGGKIILPCEGKYFGSIFPGYGTTVVLGAGIDDDYLIGDFANACQTSRQPAGFILNDQADR